MLSPISFFSPLPRTDTDARIFPFASRAVRRWWSIAIAKFSVARLDGNALDIPARHFRTYERFLRFLIARRLDVPRSQRRRIRNKRPQSSTRNSARPVPFCRGEGPAFPLLLSSRRVSALLRVPRSRRPSGSRLGRAYARPSSPWSKHGYPLTRRPRGSSLDCYALVGKPISTNGEPEGSTTLLVRKDNLTRPRIGSN